MINAKYFMDKDFEKSSIANGQPRQKPRLSVIKGKNMKKNNMIV